MTSSLTPIEMVIMLKHKTNHNNAFEMQTDVFSTEDHNTILKSSFQYQGINIL